MAKRQNICRQGLEVNIEVNINFKKTKFTQKVLVDMYISISKTLLKKFAKSQTNVFHSVSQNICTKKFFFSEVYVFPQKVPFDSKITASTTLPEVISCRTPEFFR